jgi:hypothetical protein
MTSWLLIAAGVVWLLSLGWVIQDAYPRFPASTLTWWAFLTLFLGPLAVPLYLSERMTRQAQMNKTAFSGGRDVPVPEGHRPFRPAGLRLAEESRPSGSGIFVVVEEGPDAPQQVEIPHGGWLTIRRAVGAEKSRAGVLVLHDPAVSRQSHCRLWLQNGRVMLEDNSSYGTTVDETRIVGGVVVVHAETSIRIGKTLLHVWGV